MIASNINFLINVLINANGDIKRAVHACLEQLHSLYLASVRCLALQHPPQALDRCCCPAQAFGMVLTRQEPPPWSACIIYAILDNCAKSWAVRPCQSDAQLLQTAHNASLEEDHAVSDGILGGLHATLLQQPFNGLDYSIISYRLLLACKQMQTFVRRFWEVPGVPDSLIYFVRKNQCLPERVSHAPGSHQV